MRIAAGLIAGMFLAGAWAAEADKPAQPPGRSAQADLFRKMGELERRANQLYPRRRDTPLRVLNMTDDEVREVEVIARKHEMPVLMNISPVVTGCPCEEGGACTEQVYIVSEYGDDAAGLQLSRSKNLWTVGVVQKWWLEYADLLSRQHTMTYREFMDARMLKLLEFPMCQQPDKIEDKSRQVAGNSPTK